MCVILRKEVRKWVRDEHGTQMRGSPSSIGGLHLKDRHGLARKKTMGD
jgi:hypothetical protein